MHPALWLLLGFVLGVVVLFLALALIPRFSIRVWTWICNVEWWWHGEREEEP